MKIYAVIPCVGYDGDSYHVHEVVAVFSNREEAVALATELFNIEPHSSVWVNGVKCLSMDGGVFGNWASSPEDIVEEFDLDKR